MRLSVSNIAWDRGDDPAFLALVSGAGFHHVDVAPTKIWPDWMPPPGATERFAAELAQSGLSACGMQSIFFGTANLNIFAADEAEWQRCRSHLRRVAGIARAIGATRVVFGAPGNRDPGSMAPGPVTEMACARLRELGADFLAADAVLCMEPVPADAGGRFLRTTTETAAMVRMVDHPGIGLNLDSAFLTGEGADIPRVIESCADVIAHAHASEPGLGNFAAPAVDHRAVAAALRAIGYAGCVAIEMRAVSGQEESNLRRALAVVGDAYAH